MKEITYNQNEKTLEALQNGYNTSWDIFLYGDKKSGTKPGNIYVYGTIAGQKEVAKSRLTMREKLLQGNLEK